MVRRWIVRCFRWFGGRLRGQEAERPSAEGFASTLVVRRVDKAAGGGAQNPLVAFVPGQGKLLLGTQEVYAGAVTVEIRLPVGGGC
jgi:hypothetical protein